MNTLQNRPHPHGLGTSHDELSVRIMKLQITHPNLVRSKNLPHLVDVLSQGVAKFRFGFMEDIFVEFDDMRKDACSHSPWSVQSRW